MPPRGRQLQSCIPASVHRFNIDSAPHELIDDVGVAVFGRDVYRGLHVVVDGVGVCGGGEEGLYALEIAVEDGEVECCLVGIDERGDVGIVVEGVYGSEVLGLGGLEERQKTGIGWG